MSSFATRRTSSLGVTGPARQAGPATFIDPAALISPRHLLSTWVVAESALLADALATALYFVPPKVLLPHFAFEYLILNPDFVAEHSAGLRGELFVPGAGGVAGGKSSQSNDK